LKTRFTIVTVGSNCTILAAWDQFSALITNFLGSIDISIAANTRVATVDSIQCGVAINTLIGSWAGTGCASYMASSAVS
jgi:hypothetical protein